MEDFTPETGVFIYITVGPYINAIMTIMNTIFACLLSLTEKELMNRNIILMLLQFGQYVPKV